MRLDVWLAERTTQLLNAGVQTARLDCLVLLADELDKDKGWLLSHSEHKLQGSILEKLNTKIAQRAMHTPLAYIRGHAEFYGRAFIVNTHTLVPRPETESIIELVKSLSPTAGSHILDIGTGSGCVAITAALELPDAIVSACDIDEQCLKTARQNAQKLHAKVTFFKSDLLSTSSEQDILLANLPYVPANFAINTAATYEPPLALFGGIDGLDLYRKLFDQINRHSWRPKYLITESLSEQHDTLAQLAAATGLNLKITDGLVQLFVSK